MSFLVVTNVEPQEDVTNETEKRCIIEECLTKIMILGGTIIQFKGKFGRNVKYRKIQHNQYVKVPH